MPKALTDKIVKSRKPDPNRTLNIRDGSRQAAGLELRVFPSGEKRWAVRYRNAHGRQRTLTLGDAASISLADARELARKADLEIKNGRDPAEDKKKRREADTVAEFAEVYMTRYAIGPGGKKQPNKRSWRNDQAILDADVLPKWKHRAMREITRRDVRELLQGIVDRGAPIHANRVRACLSKMFKFAITEDVVDSNPVRDTERPAKERVRERHLSPDEVRSFWKFTEPMAAIPRAIWRLRLLTGQRPQNEVAKMEWNELDLDAGWWVIPGTKTKNKRSHRVPLSAQAIALLGAIPRPKEPVGKARFVFRGWVEHAEIRTGKHFPLAGFQPRDLRTTMRTMMEADGIPARWAEEVQNHKQAGIARHYNMHEYDTEKRQALDHWARRLTAIVTEADGSHVLPFAQRA